MTNEQMAARLEDMATDLVCFGIPESDQIVLRAGAEALRVMDEEDGPVIDPLQCGTFNDQTPTGPVVRVGRDLWKQIRDEKAAALREVERLREALGVAEDTFRHYGVYHAARGNKDKADKNHALADRMAAALAGTPTPDPRDARIAELGAALRVAKDWMKNAASDDVMAVVDSALKVVRA